MYTGLKHLHMLCAVLSIVGFTVRGVWMLRDSAMLQKKWVKIAPHIIDTILLVTAFSMAFMVSQYPFTADWLTAKLIALIAYIVLGMVALKRGKTKPVRAVAFVLALITFAYILGVARSKDVLFFM